jgi:LmbE family N-acetylglucosaminyl deacetylase
LIGKKMKYKKALTFFANAGDETFLMGATLSRLAREGCFVDVCVPTNDIKDIDEKELNHSQIECMEASKKVGCKEVYFGKFPENQMDVVSLLEVTRYLEEIIEKSKPEVIFTHSMNSININEQICYKAVIEATKPQIDSRIDIICCDNSNPNLYIGISKMDLEIKLQAMELYKSKEMLDPYFRSPEVITALAKLRGSESGNYWAEAFTINKIFN